MFGPAALSGAFALHAQVDPLTQLDPLARRGCPAPPATPRHRSSASPRPRTSPARTQGRTRPVPTTGPAWCQFRRRRAARPRCPTVARLDSLPRPRPVTGPATGRVSPRRDRTSTSGSHPTRRTLTSGAPVSTARALRSLTRAACARTRSRRPVSAPTPVSALPPSHRPPISKMGVGATPPTWPTSCALPASAGAVARRRPSWASGRPHPLPIPLKTHRPSPPRRSAATSATLVRRRPRPLSPGRFSLCPLRPGVSGRPNRRRTGPTRPSPAAGSNAHTAARWSA